MTFYVLILNNFFFSKKIKTKRTLTKTGKGTGKAAEAEKIECGEERCRICSYRFTLLHHHSYHIHHHHYPLLLLLSYSQTTLSPQSPFLSTLLNPSPSDAVTLTSSIRTP